MSVTGATLLLSSGVTDANLIGASGASASRSSTSRVSALSIALHANVFPLSRSFMMFALSVLMSRSHSSLANG